MTGFELMKTLNHMPNDMLHLDVVFVSKDPQRTTVISVVDPLTRVNGIDGNVIKLS